jgi:hypothetical protein
MEPALRSLATRTKAPHPRSNQSSASAPRVKGDPRPSHVIEQARPLTRSTPTYDRQLRGAGPGVAGHLSSEPGRSPMRSLVVRRSGRSIRRPTHRDCKQHVATGRSCSCGALLGRAGDQRRRLPVPHRPRYLYRPSLAGRVHRGEARGRNCCRQTAERHHRRKNWPQADLRWRHGRCAAGHAKARRSRPSPCHSSRTLTPGERHHQQISSTSAARRYAFEKIDGLSRVDRTIRSTNGRRRWRRMAFATRQQVIDRRVPQTCHNELGAAGNQGQTTGRPMPDPLIYVGERRYGSSS